MGTMMEEEAERALRRLFAARAEVLLAYLFGSQATGRAVETSDYDFGVLLCADANPDCRYELAHELAELLDAQAVDVVLLGSAPVELVFNVISQGRLIYELDRAQRVEFEACVMARYGDFLPVLMRQREDIVREALGCIRSSPACKDDWTS